MEDFYIAQYPSALIGCIVHDLMHYLSILSMWAQRALSSGAQSSNTSTTVVLQLCTTTVSYSYHHKHTLRYLSSPTASTLLSSAALLAHLHHGVW